MNTYQPTNGTKSKNGAGADINAIKDDTETLKADIDTLKKDAKALADHAIKDGKEMLADASDKACAKLDTAKDQGRVQMQRAEEYVRSNPTQSLAYAFLGGIVLSLLFRKG